MALACANHPDVVTGLSECGRCGQSFCGDCTITLGGKPICSACKQQNLLDIRSGAGEGLDLAGRGARLGAYLIDTLVFIFGVVLLVLLATLIMVAILKSAAMAGITIVYVIGLICFPVTYEALMLARYGQTLGKMAMRIKVVRRDGQPVTTKGAWGRSASRVLMNFVPVLGLVDILCIFGDNRSCLHDRMASTAVVNASR